MRLVAEDNCDHCGLATEETNRILGRCEAFCKGLQILITVLAEPSDLKELPSRLIPEFIKKTRRFAKVTQVGGLIL